MWFLDRRCTAFRSYRMKSLYHFKEKCSIFGLCYRCLSSTATANTLKNLEAPVERHPFSRTVLQSIHYMLQSCARHGQAMEGKACHAHSIHFGFNIETLTSNILINMYSKCHLHYDARKVFDQMPQRSLVSWNTMISSHAQNGEQQEALLLFVQMQREDNSPFSEFTLSSVVCACAAKCALPECRQLHAVAIKAVMDDNEFVGTALLDLYAKCGLIKDASSVFEFLQNKSAVTWSSMVAGYVRNELYDEALVLFHRAQVTGLEHNKFTISSAISACAGMAALIEGNQVHSIMWKTGFGSNDFVASSLVDMYARCGCIKEAYLVYTDTEDKNIVLFNSMISGFAKHAKTIEAMILFEKMQQISVYPNDLTYVSILSACSHAGLVEKGRRYFDLMTEEHKVQPNVVHYSCMVDILSRAGLLNDAYALIGQMPFDATASMWGSLLGSCRIHRNLDLAEIAANKLFEIEPNNAGNHVLLSNLYAADKKWDEVAKARKLLKESEVKKEKGKSWIEIKDKVHYFMVGERNHPRIIDIYLKMDSLMEDMHKLGYRAETAHDLHDVEEMKKQELLRHHSEKLALAYGLMCLPTGVAIRIMKNLRICVDCHSFMKYASGYTKREIIVRDTNRFHHFADGRCSCGDFW